MTRQLSSAAWEDDGFLKSFSENRELEIVLQNLSMKTNIPLGTVSFGTKILKVLQYLRAVIHH